MLDKSFSPDGTETSLYALWEASGAFGAQPASTAAPYTIMIPPPNVTGTLHIGHALTMTLQDTLIRWRRMQGRDVLWQPGTDHAGIATQLVVERMLQKEGTSRQEMGRDAFVERVWEWKAESGGGITKQLRRLGSSLDWKRERFTMDDGLSDAVKEVFVTLYREGLIYRDRRLVNWDPAFRSAISDLEVDNRETRGSLWYIRYPVEGQPGRTITVATTRPETMLGDMAVAVHPDDARYADLVGRNVILPLTGRRIPIVADEHSDPTKGSGAVKITPAHDFNDFEVGRRHRLDMPSVLDEEARITLAEIEGELRAEEGLADPAFVRTLEGMPRDAARKAMVAELERLEWLEKIEPHTNQVPHAERSGAVVEPRLTTQWYCDAKTLAGPAIEAVESGQIEFVPRQWENTFYAWMRDIQPWCISRQLWWGHRIPAWYGPDGHVFVAHDEADATAQARSHYGQDTALTRDEDVLDTWFSSALWPFSTLGWPERTADLARYYPTDVLVTGFDIIFFWVARMMMMGLHFMKDVPFRKVFIHGLVRDERGQKMSKSKGNGIDPLEMIDTYGADATRFCICALTGLGRDVKLGRKRVEEYRSFMTKIWNAARFCEMNGVAPVEGFSPASVRSPLGRWILAELAQAVEDATKALESFRFDEYAATCYRFVWNCFCDWFLEFAKPVFGAGETAEAVETRAVAAHVLGTILRLMQPVTPFMTDTLWQHFGFGAEGTLMTAPWPQPEHLEGAAAARDEMEWLIRFISAIRTVRSEMNVPPSRLAPVLLRDASATTVARAAQWSEAIGRMARVSEVLPLEGDMPQGAAQLVVDEATLVIPLAGIIDIAQERLRLEKECAKVEGEITKVERKLGNADFVARAKPEVVAENRERLDAFMAERTRLQAALARIG
ncbi:valine--tRNA ligase [Komagataeibacter rhaeticus]|uniref:Valine--tRNA ligase n=1 Tax=Komagataeibacter rhaeticus TaxID=215221 RepID=A0A181C922_9PROT|nr:valine--tRNA ligase [Komagataeibacter rhaeticus]ATU72212.1 valine--tRNA ligase [Komagataeibacter xylinus]QIP36938.1 valine--tRNA ligase [Komagataeibacter rhaeticus]QOC48098.1 valine--tRNA ligase [Komagataeibacter rhaeticus]WPP23585.1 valine--tRNA ligase [Komagataeibacter rhaeticus]SAY48046.1 Valine--tRNA ligase [Komagataeibacter rhaeticus]